MLMVAMVVDGLIQLIQYEVPIEMTLSAVASLLVFTLLTYTAAATAAALGVLRYGRRPGEWTIAQQPSSPLEMSSRTWLELDGRSQPSKRCIVESRGDCAVDRINRMKCGVEY
eukprot:scaffold5937_cov74-Skeletonema_dohrnii-CCMP3373.AAC.2